jgi:ATP-dependent 26S proteasome regulatory subunit
MNSNTPAGRMAVLNGEPGTGKTYLVRAMLMDVPNATFLLIPPTMIPELSGPNLISLLLENRHSFSSNGPTILVLEDADYCLAPRKSDNMSAISSILNMGDGIFGSLFDIRILATTNAETQEIDPAILRAGRLSARINVDKLDSWEATNVLKRLIPDTNVSVHKKMTIAEVYKMARENGWVPPQNPVDNDEEEDDEEYEE